MADPECPRPVETRMIFQTTSLYLLMSDCAATGDQTKNQTTVRRAVFSRLSRT